jgi:hypothetical protein
MKIKDVPYRRWCGTPIFWKVAAILRTSRAVYSQGTLLCSSNTIRIVTSTRTFQHLDMSPPPHYHQKLIVPFLRNRSVGGSTLSVHKNLREVD